MKKIAAAIASAVCICSCTQELQQEEMKKSYLFVSPDTLTITEGERATLKATIKETVQAKVTRNEDVTSSKETEWLSSDEDVAEVEKGRVTAVSPGKAEIMTIHGQKQEKTVVMVLEKTKEPDKDNTPTPEDTEDNKDKENTENPDEPEEDDQNKENEGKQDQPYTELTTSLQEHLDTIAVAGEKMVIEFKINKDKREKIYAQVDGYGASSIEIDTQENKGTLSFIVGEGNAFVYLSIDDRKTFLQYVIEVKTLWAKSSEETKHKTSADAKTIPLMIRTNVPEEDLAELIKTDTGCSWISIDIDKTETVPEGYSLKAEITPNEDNRKERTSEIKIWVETQGGRSREVSYTITQYQSNPKIDGYVWFECLEMKKATVEKYDTNDDGEISYEEADEITELDLKDRGVTSTIGIEHMHHLQKLDIRGNLIPDGGVIDLSGEHYWFNEIYNDNRNVKIDLTGCAVEVNGINYSKEKIRTNQYFNGNQLGAEIKPETYTSKDLTRDGETVVLWNHTEGDGIPVLLKGQYFVDIDVNTGYYDKLMKEVAQSLFDVEPYKSFKEYFDVSYEINIDEKRLPKEGPFSDVGYEYGTYIINVSTADFRSSACCGWGYSAYISLNDILESEYVVAHEFGHSFGLLCDEYDNSEYYEYGRVNGPNISYTDDLEEVPWSRFLKHDTYKHYVGIYEGAAYYKTNVWRPSEDSIMRNSHKRNIYNAPSRYAIFKKIVGLSHYMLNKYGQDGFTEEDFWNEFVKYDVINLRDEDRITPVIP